MKKEILVSSCDLCHTSQEDEYRPGRATTLPRNWVHLMVFDERRRDLAEADACPPCSRRVLDCVRGLTA